MRLRREAVRIAAWAASRRAESISSALGPFPGTRIGLAPVSLGG